MISITVPFDNPQVEVNGHVFEPLRSDGQVYKDALAIKAKYEKLDTNDPEAVLTAVDEACEYVDAVLGEGAMLKISDGKPVSINSAINAMLKIAEAVVASYSTNIKKLYE